MSSLNDKQNKSSEQALKEEIQQLRRQNEDLARQVRALLATQLPYQPPVPNEPEFSSTNTSEPIVPQPLRELQEPNLQAKSIAAIMPTADTSVTISTAPTTMTTQATDKQMLNQMEHIFKRIKILEGNKGIEDLAQFCIVTDIEIPKDFEVPKFEKYDGTTDPHTHIQMYCSKMDAYLKNKKLMMYYFQESLKGAAIRWYLNLDKKEVHTWGDLASAFLKHYKHNADFAPDKSSLKKLTMNEDEDFCSFALRWRNQAAQVEPPMIEKELVDAFIEVECLDQPYKLSCANAIDFAHLVRIGIRVEKALEDSKHGCNEDDILESRDSNNSTIDQGQQE